MSENDRLPLVLIITYFEVWMTPSALPLDGIPGTPRTDPQTRIVGRYKSTAVAFKRKEFAQSREVEAWVEVTRTKLPWMTQ